MTLFKDRYRVESARLRGWDYATGGWYFVTICTREREHFFGKVDNREMRLSPIGEIACEYWQTIPQHTSGNVELDDFIVMPNHVHGIIIHHVETLHATSLHGHATSLRDVNNPMSQISPIAGSLGALVRSYKSAVSRWCTLNGYKAFAWQSRFYDHIIRDEPALQKIRQYIENNPIKWDTNQNNPANLWM